ncbi:LysR family transcriptional regulator [Bacillus sp. HNG]|uniref:LysR family transcriptional regulator n=1 Tax=Bacillus sp. HNG TaxID=2293325 RepID=UPI000E2EA6E9|nr:LysR family transcriptional regulator [Bacillus sp. HNG]RFB18371.1 LysR family transcriptional regulator [Bacillus sp. HNG]
MRSQDWEILKVLYENKNITKTGKQLFISQPALTNRIKQIEKEFGIKIINRDRRGVKFTPQGEYLAKSAEEMILKLRQIKDNLTNMESKVVGTINLGVSSFFTKYKLPQLLRAFKDKYPNVEFKVTTGWSRDLFHSLYKKDIHIAFVRGEYTWMEQKRLLFEDQLCVASKEKMDLKNLPDLPRINYKTDNFLKSIIDHWWMENYTKPSKITMEVDQVDTCKEMVVNGLGYAIMPSMILKGNEDIHKVFIKDKENNPLIRNTWMLYHNESLEVNVINAFVTFIESFDLHDL